MKYYLINGEYGSYVITNNGIMESSEYVIENPEHTTCIMPLDHYEEEIPREALMDPVANVIKQLLDGFYTYKGSIDDIDIVKFDHSYPTKLFITVKHGDVEITNSLGHFNLLKDVYTNTKITIDNYTGTIRFYDLELLRGTINTWENHKKVCHPHRRGFNSMGYSSMCLGISDIYEDFFQRRRKYFDMEMYFRYLDSYIAWESREGGPYSSIAYLYDTKDRPDISISDDKVIQLLYDNREKIQPIFSNKLYISSDILNEISEDFDIPKVNECSSAFTDINIFCRYNTGTIQTSELNHFFRGKKIPFVIEDLDLEIYEPYIRSTYKQFPSELIESMNNIINQLLYEYSEKFTTESVEEATV